MTEIFLKDIDLSETDRVGLMTIWEGHHVINRNLTNIIEDFDFMNQKVRYEVENLTPAIEDGIKSEKMKMLNAHICGMICTLTPESSFNRNHITESGETVKEVEKKTKTSDFAKSLQI